MKDLLIRNRVRQSLAAGHLALGVSVFLARTPNIAPIFAACGYDWLFIDLEHTPMDLDAAAHIALSALHTGIAPLVRVPSKQYSIATRLLDAGALGIVMPHIDTEEDAKELVRELTFPPSGTRSCGYNSPHFDFQSVPVATSTTLANEACLIVAMLETRRAIDNSDAIAAVKGIDVLLVGTNDLTMDMRIPGQFDSPQVDDAYRAALKACKDHGKVCGMAGISSIDQIKRYVDWGVRFILAGGDLNMMIDGASRREKALRALLNPGPTGT